MKSKAFIYGTILTAIGAAVSTFATFFLFLYLIPLWIFLLGITLIWISNKRIRTKVLWTLTPIVVFFLYQLMWYQFNKMPPETFLIPEHYRGKIHIHFNMKCGAKQLKEKNRRVYQIPETGILLTQFNDKQGFIDQEYFLVDRFGNRKLLSILTVHDYNEEWTIEKNPVEPSRNILGIFHAGRVSSEGSYEFYVSTYYQLRDSFGFHYDKRFDSLEQKLIVDCNTIGK